MDFKGRTSPERQSTNNHLRNFLIFLALFTISISLTGCNGSDSSSDDETDISVSGYVIDGPISGSSVTLHEVDSDGSTGEQVAGPFTTDASGEWNGMIPNNVTGKLVIVAVGGQYTDDATGETITLADGEKLHSWFDASSPEDSGVVSPITDSLWQVARNQMSQGESANDAINSIEQLASDFWSLDPTSITPDESSENTNQQRYGVLLAAFSFLMDNNTNLQSAPFASMDRFTLMRLIMNDMADGRLDGLDLNDIPVLAADGTPLPALSRHDLSALFREANARAESLAIDDIEEDPLKKLSPYSYTLSCPDNGLYLYGPYVDNLPANTTGLQDITPSLPGNDDTYAKVVRLNVDLDEVEVIRSNRTSPYTGEAQYTDTYTVPFESDGLFGGLDLSFVVNGSASAGSGVSSWRLFTSAGAYFGEIGTYDPELSFLSNEHIYFTRRTRFDFNPGFGEARQEAYLCGNAFVGTGGSPSYAPAGQTHDDKYFVGGTVGGLNGSVVLQNNEGNNLTISSAGPYNFSVALDDEAFYNVSILTQPDTQTCSLAHSAGQIDGHNISSVNLTCENYTYSIGGTLNGLGDNDELVLQNNAGDSLSRSQNGAFAFGTQLEESATYSVTVLSNSRGQSCAVDNESGTVSQSNVTNIAVACSDLPAYTIGGAVSGLSGSLELTNSNGDIVQTSTNGNYNFSEEHYTGESFSVSISSSPASQLCSISNASGSISDSNIDNINVTCIDSSLLTGLAISEGTLAPAFNTEISSYNVTVGDDVSSIALTPTASDSNASITVDGESLSSGETSTPINLSNGDNAITVEVVASDGDSNSNYIITVTRGESENTTQIFFPGDSGLTGYELWKTDGTNEGTELVKDINPEGSSLDYSFSGHQLDTVFYFVANDGEHGEELWRTDGTEAGTTLLKDINPDGDSDPQSFTTIGTTLFFWANDGTNGSELWKTDGSESGTTMVKDINTTLGDGSRTFTKTLFDLDGTLFFAANDGVNGTELWKSDGTSDGTILVKNIFSTTIGGQEQGSNPSSFAALDGTLFFSAADSCTQSSGRCNYHNTELWTSDGTSENTQMVTRLYQSIGRGGSNPKNLTAYGSDIFFSARTGTGNSGLTNYELWKSDGTESGTSKVKEINDAAFGSSLRGSNPNELMVLNNTLIFTAQSPVGDDIDVELWKSDGTETGTVVIKNINTSSGSWPDKFAIVGSELFFVARDDTHGDELWKTDGTEAGTVLIKDIIEGSGDPVFNNYFGVHEGTLYMDLNDGIYDTELWKSDGSDDGTSMVKDLNPAGHGIPEYD